MSDQGAIFSTDAARKVAGATRGYNATPVDARGRDSGRRVRRLDTIDLLISSDAPDGGVYYGRSLGLPDDDDSSDDGSDGDTGNPLSVTRCGKPADTQDILFYHMAELGRDTHVITAGGNTNACLASGRVIGTEKVAPYRMIVRGWADSVNKCTLSDVMDSDDAGDDTGSDDGGD